MRRITRRRFFHRSTRTLLGLSSAAVWTSGSYLKGGSPGEELILAAVGVGGRGSTLVRGFASRADVEFAAICDLDPRRGHDLVKELAAKQGKVPQRVLELRRALDDKSVDAVVI